MEDTGVETSLYLRCKRPVHELGSRVKGEGGDKVKSSQLRGI